MFAKYFPPGSLFAHRDFLRFFISNSLVVIGSGSFVIALAVVVLDNGGDASLLGLILAARMLSLVIFTLAGGVWADRIARKYVMISADVFRGVLALMLVLASLPSIPHYVMALIVFLMGVGDAFGGPAASAILPGILPQNLLQKGNVARGVVTRTGSIIGPAIGGALVATIGGRLTFLFTAATYLTGAILLLTINENPQITSVEDRQPFIHELKEGLKTVWSIPWIAASILMATFQLLVSIASQSVLLPIVTRREFHTNTVFALSEAAFAIGAVISSLYFLKFKVKHPGLVSILIWCLFGAANLALAFPINEVFVVGMFIIAGISVGPWEAYWSYAIQKEVPQELQGRVFSVDQMGSLGLLPLGMALTGPVSVLVGEQQLLIFAAIFHAAVGLLTLLVPGVKDLKMPVKNYSESEQIRP